MLALALAAAACSGADSRTEAFCDRLGEATGPSGVESLFVPGDPARIDGVVNELSELHDAAPEEIASTTRTLLSFFRSYQRAARDERRDVIAAAEQDLAEASVALNDYALSECGLLLQRVVPTPRPTFDPNLDAPITD